MKKGQYSKSVVALVILLNVIFAGCVLAVFWHTGSEPVALVGAWFAFTTGELWLVAKIRRDKLKGEKSDELEAEVGTETGEPEVLDTDRDICG
ncbi:MAG: hypothetical protein PHX43_05410 [Alphaproteobacteria bacterium]|nr:hypothetical protein [Alphaproteobacteria bacterium]